MACRAIRYLPDAAGDLQDTASRAVPRKRIWKNCHYVSNDQVQCRRGSPDQKRIVEEVKASLAEQGIEYGNPEQGYHDRDPGGCHHQR